MPNIICRHPECDKTGTHRLWNLPGDGFRYSILHCEEHLEWAKETMNEFNEARKSLNSIESPVEF